MREIHIEPKNLRIDPESLKRILRIGLPAGLQSAVFAVSNIVVQSGHQQTGDGGYGGIQRGVQHRNHHL